MRKIITLTALAFALAAVLTIEPAVAQFDHGGGCGSGSGCRVTSPRARAIAAASARLARAKRWPWCKIWDGGEAVNLPSIRRVFEDAPSDAGLSVLSSEPYSPSDSPTIILDCVTPLMSRPRILILIGCKAVRIRQHSSC